MVDLSLEALRMDLFSDVPERRSKTSGTLVSKNDKLSNRKRCSHKASASRPAITKTLSNAGMTQRKSRCLRPRGPKRIPSVWQRRQMYSEYRFLWQLLRSTGAPQEAQILDMRGWYTQEPKLAPSRQCLTVGLAKIFISSYIKKVLTMHLRGLYDAIFCQHP